MTWQTGWLIRSDEGFWSNDQGWVDDRASATHFDSTDGLDLPIGDNVRWVDHRHWEVSEVTEFEFHICVQCEHCAHFVDYEYDDAQWTHLDNGEQQLGDLDEKYDHDAAPGQARLLTEWREANPWLFMTYADGNIGPNSSFYPFRNGWRDRRRVKHIGNPAYTAWIKKRSGLKVMALTNDATWWVGEILESTLHEFIPTLAAINGYNDELDAESYFNEEVSNG